MFSCIYPGIGRQLSSHGYVAKRPKGMVLSFVPTFRGERQAGAAGTLPLGGSRSLIQPAAAVAAPAIAAAADRLSHRSSPGAAFGLQGPLEEGCTVS